MKKKKKKNSSNDLKLRRKPRGKRLRLKTKKMGRPDGAGHFRLPGREKECLGGKQGEETRINQEQGGQERSRTVEDPPGKNTAGSAGEKLLWGRKKMK